MSMEGTIRNRNGKMYVLYATTDYSTPTRTFTWWRVLESYSNRYNMNRPEDGDTAVYSGNGNWNVHSRNGAAGRVITGDGSTQAETVEKVSVEPPATRGKELRWKDGRWEKLMASGWVAAGEGSPSAGTKKPRKKTAKQLDAEIARELENKS